MGRRSGMIIQRILNIDKDRLLEVIESSRGGAVDQGTGETEDVGSNLDIG